MGTGASTQANLMISPREELARKTAQKIGDEKPALDSHPIVDLTHGTVRYRSKENAAISSADDHGKVKTGYFYHANLEGYERGKALPAQHNFKLHYVTKGPTTDGNKQLHYVYGIGFNAKDSGIRKQPYKPQGKGYNWPKSFRDPNCLYYQLQFAEQEGEAEFNDSDNEDIEDIKSVNVDSTETLIPEIKITVRDTDTVQDLKKRVALRIFKPINQLHVLHDSLVLSNDKVIGSLRKDEHGKWEKFTVILKLT
ncbi:hypothetical protein TrispH2_001377 [Trichoplax sp. H2]|nr:hypothetical protein TrispH2_001377 [Trichoplax sp. H2]|eukprot:RDD46138.1 hypothetical protein TrispH2_001377 [Trichoplax sp. H2]